MMLAFPYRPLIRFRHSTPRPATGAMTDKPLTLSQMAERLGITTKTFRKDVTSKGIPYYSVGKRMRFDPEAVKAYLNTTETEQKSNVVVMVRPKRRKGPVVSKRFAEAV